MNECPLKRDHVLSGNESSEPSINFQGLLLFVFREANITEMQYHEHSTLPKTNIVMENPPFWWYLQGNMGIFMGYVSFREGMHPNLNNMRHFYISVSSGFEQGE